MLLGLVVAQPVHAHPVCAVPGCPARDFQCDGVACGNDPAAAIVFCGNHQPLP